MDMDEGGYEAVYFGEDKTLSPPLKTADIIGLLKKKSPSEDSYSKPPALPPPKPSPALPPPKPRHANGNSKLPPPLVSIKPLVALPSVGSGKPYLATPPSAPPISRKPSPGKTKNERNKFHSSSQDSAFSNDSRQFASPERKSDQEGETVLLVDLVRKHSQSLPLRVRVDEGFCGSEERFIISSGDVYNFHFIKNEKMLSIKDCGGTHFSIPFNSEIKFGLLYNPNNKFEEAVSGHVFQSVSELVSSVPPPRLVRVIGSGPVSPTKPSVGKNELLIIKKAGKTMLWNKPFVKVINLDTKEEKTLYDESQASFSTEPQRLKLYVPKILEHFSEFLPLTAMLYPPDDDDAEDLPLHLMTDMVTLAHSSIESAIIATTYWEEGDSGFEPEDHMPISIPIEMEIELTILEDTNEEVLYLDTRSLLQHFDLSKVKNMQDSEGEVQRGRAQSQHKLHRRIRKGYEYRGMDVTMSEKVYDDPGLQSVLPFKRSLDQPLPLPPQDTQLKTTSPPHIHPHSPKLPHSPKVPQWKAPQWKAPPALVRGSQLPVPPARGRSLDDDNQGPRNSHRKSETQTEKENGDGVMGDSTYQNAPLLSAPPLPPTPGHAPKLEKGPTHKATQDGSESSDSSKELADLKSTTKLLRSELNAMQENSRQDMQTLKDDVVQLKSTVEGLVQSCKKLQAEVKAQSWTASPHMSPTLGTTALTGSLRRTVDPETQEANVEVLRTMGLEELLDLLEQMKLSQYRECFVAESIDGEILAECDEAILRDELHIVNKLHRTRLMKVIVGRHSVHSLQLGSDPYGGIVTKAN